MVNFHFHDAEKFFEQVYTWFKQNIKLILTLLLIGLLFWYFYSDNKKIKNDSQQIRMQLENVKELQKTLEKKDSLLDFKSQKLEEIQALLGKQINHVSEHKAKNYKLNQLIQNKIRELENTRKQIVTNDSLAQIKQQQFIEELSQERKNVRNLEGKYDTLLANYDTLHQMYTDVTKRNSGLEKDYIKVQKQLDELQKLYDDEIRPIKVVSGSMSIKVMNEGYDGNNKLSYTDKSGLIKQIKVIFQIDRTLKRDEIMNVTIENGKYKQSLMVGYEDIAMPYKKVNALFDLKKKKSLSKGKLRAIIYDKRNNEIGSKEIILK